MVATAAVRTRVRAVETLMDARIELKDAAAADEREDTAVDNARRYVRGIISSLKAAGDADREHDIHLARAVEHFNSAMAVLDGYVQMELPVAMERAS